MLGIITDLHLQPYAANLRSTRNWLKTELAINSLRKKGISDVVILGDVIDCPDMRDKGSMTRRALKALEGNFRDMSFFYVKGNHDDLESYKFKNLIDWAKYPEYSFSAFPYTGGMELLSSNPDGKMVVFSHTPFFSLGKFAMNDDLCNYWNRKDNSRHFLPYYELFVRKGNVVSGHYHTPSLRIEPHYEGNRECFQIHAPAVAFTVTEDGFISIRDNGYHCAWLDDEGKFHQVSGTV